MNFIESLTRSEVISLFGVIASFITGCIATIISIKTLRQNSKMIEASSRPYIGIYGACTHVGTSQYYLIIKNFGNSSALVTSLTYDFDLSQCRKNHSKFEPFQYIENTTIMPGQSFRAAINFNKAILETDFIHFHISYSSGVRKYEDDICLNLKANTGNFETYTHDSRNELLTISQTIQDMHIKSL